MLLSMRNCSVLSALSTWRVNMERQRLLQACIRISKDQAERLRFRRAYASNKMISRLQMKRQYVIFGHWCENVINRRSLCGVLDQFVGKRMLAVCANALRKWTEEMSSPSLLPAFNYVVSKTAKARVLSSPFYTWLLQCQHSRCLDHAGRVSHGREKLRTLLTHFKIWGATVSAGRTKRRARLRSRRRLLRRCVRRWERARRTGAEQREAAAALGAERGLRRLLAAWESWLARAGERCRLQQALQLFHLKSAFRV